MPGAFIEINRLLEASSLLCSRPGALMMLMMAEEIKGQETLAYPKRAVHRHFRILQQDVGELGPRPDYETLNNDLQKCQSLVNGGDS